MYKFAIPAACLLLATLLTACGGDYQAKKEELEELKEKYNALATQAESWQALSETERAKKTQAAQAERLAAQTVLQPSYDPAAIDAKRAAQAAAEQAVQQQEQKNAYKNLISVNGSPIDDGMSITLENDLPMSVDNYDYGETRKRTCEITGISAAQNDYSITITLSGSKTYDHQGENYSSSCNIGWKLYHGESAVADSGTAYSPDIAVGETFKAEIILYKDDLTSGSYTLQLLDTD